jgi:hypothetical protein
VISRPLPFESLRVARDTKKAEGLMKIKLLFLFFSSSSVTL